MSQESSVFYGRQKGPLVLILEDQEAEADLLASFLRREGYEARIVPRLEDALAAVRERRPIAIVFDERLSERDGWTMLWKLLRDSPLRDLPCIQIALQPEPLSRPTLNGEVNKPVREEELREGLRRIHEYLERFPSKVLLVDDDEGVRKVVRKFLERSGYQVEEAKEGMEALRIAFQTHPDIILMDLVMPGMDGFETIERLRAYPATMSIPILVLTGKILTDEDRARIRQKVFAIFQKSQVTFEKLLWHLKWLEKLKMALS